MASTTPPPPKKSSGGPLILGAALLLLGVGVMYLVKRSGAPEPAPVESAPVAATTSEEPVSDAPPPPPPPPPEPIASADAGTEVKPTRRSGPAGCAGPCEGAEPAGLQGQLAAKAGLARGCYERALRQNPTLQGRMRVTVRVAPNGSVCNANVTQNELGDAGVASCVSQIFRSATFAAPQVGCVEAAVPLRFSPKG
jgi:hypothetical protein